MTKLADGAVEIVEIPLKDNKKGLRITFNKNVETRKVYKIKRSGIYMHYEHKIISWK